MPDGTDAAWAKIRFGPDGWTRLASVLPRITDEPVLVVVANAIRDAVRDAELAPPVALDLILAAVPGVADETIVDALLRFAADQLAGPYAPPAERPARLARVAQTAETLLRGAAPGSDRQLAAFRLVVRCTSDHVLLRGWFDGRAAAAGGGAGSRARLADRAAAGGPRPGSRARSRRPWPATRVPPGGCRPRGRGPHSAAPTPRRRPGPG